MVVWLRYGQGTVGIPGGLIRAADFANLVSTEDVLHSLGEQSHLLLVRAQATSEQMLSEAGARVSELVAAAEVIKREAASEGLRLGRNEAIDARTKKRSRPGRSSPTGAALPPRAATTAG